MQVASTVLQCVCVLYTFPRTPHFLSRPHDLKTAAVALGTSSDLRDALNATGDGHEQNLFLEFHRKRKARFTAQRKWNQNHLQVKKEADELQRRVQTPDRCLSQV